MDNHQTLTRRATATDEDITNLLQRQSSLPEEIASPTELPDTSHKRKQSDVAFDNLNIGQSDLRATFELERIEQGVEEDDDQAHPHPLRSPLVSPTSSNLSSSTTQRPLLSFPAMKNVRFIAAFIVFATVATLSGVKRSRGGSFSDDGWGWEMVGDGIWFENEESDWLEYYPDPARLPKMVSTGPQRVADDLGGMHLFTDVCVTNNIDSAKPPELDTSVRGLVYFDKRMSRNPKRCVPCSTKAMNARAEDKWGESSSLDSQLGHQCGMQGLHAMYASSVTDWNDCTAETENRQFMIRNRQNQSPSHAKNVHYFEEPTLLMSFKANDRESSLFEFLFTYLPYWHVFRKEGYPFDSVFSKSVQGCLSHSRNWFCELTHQMGAFGYARETNWEETHATMYCFKNLYFNQQSFSYSRQITKQIMDEFRDEVFSHFGLPRSRDRKDITEKDGQQLAMRILLHANKTGENNRWDGLDKLIKSVTGKHPHVDFHIVQDFDIPIAEQARLFNSADAVVMATGDHMANSIFVPDDTVFVELSCGLFSRTSDPRFMELIAGSTISVASSSCSDSKSDATCISCLADQSSFTMSNDSFEALVDDIVKRHKEKTSVVRDGR
eukprot:CAMPEP_0201719030 /NCGR_PEP_ID=MMETSP0593-20130828/4372_1 /ASSEMBLY_ACC=CAM_ASM_000672 /TAXON_ID=267983 /ORGANISM="Skeletonema japonicum, Strain CCMP2506" /LENGTH=608 /DNA_ID=CAMNT_0048209421 /DNA_START=91 /DNA_END=1917 /DNA_ORIENTATION=+